MSIPEMMKMRFREDILPWWKRMERQIAEDSILQEYSKKADGAPPPEGKAMERAIDKKIKEWYREVD